MVSHSSLELKEGGGGSQELKIDYKFEDQVSFNLAEDISYLAMVITFFKAKSYRGNRDFFRLPAFLWQRKMANIAKDC